MSSGLQIQVDLQVSYIRKRQGIKIKIKRMAVSHPFFRIGRPLANLPLANLLGISITHTNKTLLHLPVK